MIPAKPVPKKAVKPRIEKPREKKVERRSEAGHFTGAGASATSKRTALPFATAAYTLSVHDPRELPPPGAPEIAFVGRSNAGKSSAINTLAGRRRLAFVSKTPGRTQLINFFSLKRDAFLVDLPGYGYAGVPAAVRAHWDTLVGDYVRERASLAGVVIVMDVRHPLTPLDRRLIDWLREAGRVVHILLTKADKLSKQAAQRTLAQVRRDLSQLAPGATVQLFSSLERAGIEEAASALTRLAAGKNKAPAKGE
jgi:GTP-binding protein